MRLRNPATATVVAVAAIALFAAVLPLALANHQIARGLSNGGSYLGPIGFVGVGWLIAWRQPRNSMGWLLLGTGLFGAMSGAASGYAIYAYRLHHDPGSLLAKTAIVLQPGWSPEIICMAVALVLFPDTKLPPGRWRWPLWILLATAALWMLGAYGISVSAVLHGGHIQLDNTGNLLALDHPTGAIAWWGGVQDVCLPLFVGAWLVSLAQQLRRFRLARGQERQQLKWLLTGAVVFVTCLLLDIALGSPTRGWTAWLSGIISFGFLALPITIGAGILKYRLYDIDRVISRTVSYGLLTAVLAGVYVGLVVLATEVLPLSSSVGVVLGTVVAASLFTPLRRRMQRVVDRRFNRARYDSEALVEAFAGRLREAVTTEAISHDLMTAAMRAVEPAGISIWLPGSARGATTTVEQSA